MMPYGEFRLRLRAAALRQCHQIEAVGLGQGNAQTSALTRLAELENMSLGR